MEKHSAFKSAYTRHEIKHIIQKLKRMGAKPDSIVLRIWDESLP